jgi:hypothetical protein
MISPSITETQVFTALRAFLLTIVDCEVIRLPNNRVAMPKGEFISLSPVSNIALSTNVAGYSGTDKSILRPSQVTIQVDCYGASAGDRATAITTLLRDPYGCDAFNVGGAPIDLTQVGGSYVLGESPLYALPNIQPLYASDARQMPMVDSEAAYVERWSFDCVLQFNPVLTVAQQSAAALGVGLKNVDRTFPP